MKIWEFRKFPPGKPNLRWAEDLSISDLLLKILWNRGFQDKSALERFLSAPLRNLTPPDRWPLIPSAAEILVKELLAGNQLAVWGDYDVDGITATALVLDVLEHHGFSVLHHLPDRRNEGYGLNVDYVEDLARRGCKTLLTVDCGICDFLPIQRANELGMKVIVSDHHLPADNLPDAVAIVNPRLAHEHIWPCEHLAGVGVAFYLMAAVNSLLHHSLPTRLIDCLQNVYPIRRIL